MVDVSNADDLRAMILQAMIEHATIQPRGFDSVKRRQELHRQIDDMFDDLALEILTEPQVTA